jgi:ankyrin repeat protein
VTAVDRDVQALLDAAFAGDVGTIWSLLDADSSLVWESAGGLTALHVAAMAGRDEAAALLIAKRATVDANGSSGTPLFQAALGGHEAIVARLLANGAHPDGATPSGQTPLMAAAAGGHLACGRLLIEAGANLNAKTTTGPDEQPRASLGNRRVGSPLRGGCRPGRVGYAAFGARRRCSGGGPRRSNGSRPGAAARSRRGREGAEGVRGRREDDI